MSPSAGIPARALSDPKTEALEKAAREALRLLIVERADEDIRRYGGSGIPGLERDLSGYRETVEDLLKAALSCAPPSGPPQGVQGVGERAVPPATEAVETEAGERERTAKSSTAPPDIPSSSAPTIELDTESDGQGGSDGEAPKKRPCDSCGKGKQPQEYHGPNSTTCRSCVRKRGASPWFPDAPDRSESGGGAGGVEKSKKCKECGDTKPLSAFERSQALKDGHVSTCKECRNRKRRGQRERVTPDRESESKESKESKGASEEAAKDDEEPSEAGKILKRCSKCDKRKPLSSFESNVHTADGRTNACSACLRGLSKANSKALDDGGDSDIDLGKLKKLEKRAKKEPAPPGAEKKKREGGFCASGMDCVHAPSLGGPVKLSHSRKGKGKYCFGCEDSMIGRPAGMARRG